MSKQGEIRLRGKDKQIMIVVISLTISISVIVLLWKYYDSRMAEIQQRVDIDQQILAPENIR